MAERTHQQVHPTPQPNNNLQQSAPLQSKKLNERKRIKHLACILAITLVLIAAVILTITFTIFKIKTPKFLIGSATIDNFYMQIIPTPSFDFTMRTELQVKNSNFGRYRFQNSTVEFIYDGVVVGNAAVEKGRAGSRSTEKMRVVVNFSSAKVRNASQLEKDLGVGVLFVNGRSRLSGQVEVAKVIKRKRSAEMDCVVSINLSDEIIRSLQC